MGIVQLEWGFVPGIVNNHRIDNHYQMRNSHKRETTQSAPFEFPGGIMSDVSDMPDKSKRFPTSQNSSKLMDTLFSFEQQKAGLLRILGKGVGLRQTRQSEVENISKSTEDACLFHEDAQDECEGVDLPLPKELSYLMPPQPTSCFYNISGLRAFLRSAAYQPPYGFGTKVNAVSSLVWCFWWLRRARPMFLVYSAIILAARSVTHDSRLKREHLATKIIIVVEQDIPPGESVRELNQTFAGFSSADCIPESCLSQSSMQHEACRCRLTHWNPSGKHVSNRSWCFLLASQGTLAYYSPIVTGSFFGSKITSDSESDFYIGLLWIAITTLAGPILDYQLTKLQPSGGAFVPSTTAAFMKHLLGLPFENANTLRSESVILLFQVKPNKPQLKLPNSR
eukprot:1175442-Prorocentrum_minimum.AAC.1